MAASLFNVQKVKQLAWVPATTPLGKKVKHPDGTIKGKYNCMYKEAYTDHEDGQ